jgi:hypothetical protein
MAARSTTKPRTLRLSWLIWPIRSALRCLVLVMCVAFAWIKWAVVFTC